MLRFEQQQARLQAFHYNQADTTYHNLHFESDSMCYLDEKKTNIDEFLYLLFDKRGGFTKFLMKVYFIRIEQYYQFQKQKISFL